ncbi:hypothetical protein HPB50_003482 [Hyalomma asiaticum]|uniref:Uncharacterized protein n=1 Tax=Hyalomma asiaticum TaxID=266040 RepID=A0ACB7T847_HYAAI|nr:hypothetical protein HPB50_003482 [Hyalomma asiaticum]
MDATKVIDGSSEDAGVRKDDEHVYARRTPITQKVHLRRQAKGGTLIPTTWGTLKKNLVMIAKEQWTAARHGSVPHLAVMLEE